MKNSTSSPVTDETETARPVAGGKSGRAKIAVLAGDGIGPEVMREALKVLRVVAARFSLQLDMHEAPVGWAAIDSAGNALPDGTLALCQDSDAILFGSVGLPQRDPLVAKEKRPERAALLRLRREFRLYANLRPVKLPASLASVSPLRPERQGNGIDMLVVRELTGSLYFGEPKKTEEVIDLTATNQCSRRFMRAIDTMVYTSPEIERIAHFAFRAARERRRLVTSIDKSNILENGILWREVVTAVGRHYPDVTLEHLLVDNAAMQLILRPSQFDVVLCENMFGDILSDEAAALGGSLGMLPSASLGATRGDRAFGLFEPAGGTAPDIAGKNIANPIAQISSAAMLLRYSLALPEAAEAIDSAVAKVIEEGCRTRDIYSAVDPRAKLVSTTEMGDAIAGALG